MDFVRVVLLVLQLLLERVYLLLEVRYLFILFSDFFQEKLSLLGKFILLIVKGFKILIDVFEIASSQ